TSALAAADLAVYRIVIDERAASPAPRRKPFGEHAHGLIECFPRERAIGICGAHEIEQLAFRAFARGTLRHDLLGEHIDRILRNLESIQLAATHGIEQCRAFDEIVARERE